MSSTRSDRIGDILIVSLSIGVIVIVCLWLIGAHLSACPFPAWLQDWCSP